MTGLPMKNPDPGYTNVWHAGRGLNHLPHPSATFSARQGCSLTLCGLVAAKYNTTVLLDESWARLCPRCARLRGVSDAA